MIHSAEARCFWNGFDMECHYPAPPPRVYREVYREVESVYEAPRIIQRPRIIRREIIERVLEDVPVIYHDDWR